MPSNEDGSDPSHNTLEESAASTGGFVTDPDDRTKSTDPPAARLWRQIKRAYDGFRKGPSWGKIGVVFAVILGTSEVIRSAGELVHAAETAWSWAFRPASTCATVVQDKPTSCERTGGKYVVSNVPWNDPERWLWIRELPSLRSRHKGQLAPNETGVAVTGACVDGWCPVQCGGLSGFSGQNYLTLGSDALRAVMGRVALPIHVGPNQTCSKLSASIPSGADDVIVHSCQPIAADGATWCEITYGQSSGWVEGKYLQPLPRGFIYLRDVVPTAVQDIRYFGTHNFIGRQVKGYDASECVLVKEAAQALVSVQAALATQKLSLIVWDCYRPQRAVRQFVEWVANPSDTITRAEFYPHVDKATLLAIGYLESPSAHSRGGAIDLGIVPSGTTAPRSDVIPPLKPCTAPKGERFDDGTIDLGTGFDCFDEMAGFNNPNIGSEAGKNRALLRSLMTGAGFEASDREWWHFTFQANPLAYTEFDFLVQAHPD